MSKSVIPPKAKRVFKGQIFEVWQWPQKMYDGSEHTFEALRRPNTVEIVAVAGNKIITQRQRQPHKSRPYLSLPGGRCEAGETPLASAKREFLEETGYASKDWVLFKEENPIGKMDWIIHTFIARNCVFKQPPHLDAGEKISLRLISFEQFLRLTDDPVYLGGFSLGSVLTRALYDKKFKAKFYKFLFKK